MGEAGGPGEAFVGGESVDEDECAGEEDGDPGEVAAGNTHKIPPLAEVTPSGAG